MAERSEAEALTFSSKFERRLMPAKRSEAKSYHRPLAFLLRNIDAKIKHIAERIVYCVQRLHDWYCNIYQLSASEEWDGGAWPALLGALRNLSVRLAPETDAKVRR